METSHAAHAPAAHDEGHASVQTYIRVAVVLAILTAIEIGALYVPGLPKHVLVTLILIFGTMKFALVVAFFMHLRYDNKLLTVLFVGPLLIATGIILAIMALFGAYLLLVIGPAHEYVQDEWFVQLPSLEISKAFRVIGFEIGVGLMLITAFARMTRETHWLEALGIATVLAAIGAVLWLA